MVPCYNGSKCHRAAVTPLHQQVAEVHRDLDRVHGSEKIGAHLSVT